MPQPCYRLVLVIDDDPINNQICEKLIHKVGFAREVHNFLVAAEALEWLSQVPPEAWPELILLDINMPLMDGWEFLEQLQPLLPESGLRIHILSSSVSEEDLLRARAHDLVSSFISKPLSRDSLAQL